MLNHVHIACATPKCHATITVHVQEEERLRRTGETFYCPAGHSNFFPRGKSKKDERIEQLERQLSSARIDAASWRDTSTRYREALLHDAQTCPFESCGWRGTRRLPWFASDEDLTRFFARVWQDLADHLSFQHGSESVRLHAGDAA